MMLVKIAVILCLLGSSAVYLYDFSVCVYEHYLHTFKKRWDDKTQWQQRVLRVAEKWCRKPPTLRLKKERRYLLLDIILRKSGKRMVQSWQQAGCLLGLLESPGGSEETVFHVMHKCLSSDGNWRHAPDKIDYGMLAYALLKGMPEKAEQLRPAMDQMVSCIRNNQGSDGTVSYSMGKASPRRYVDTLGFICPFLVLYGTMYNESECIQLAITLLKKYRIDGFMRRLPFHSYRIDNGEPLGVYGWGRGTGWYMLGLIDSWLVLPEGHEKHELEELICDIGDRCLEFEMENGGYAGILPDQQRYDSSATAMIGYFYARAGMHLDRPDYRAAAQRCEKRLMQATNGLGMVDCCQGDTIDIGIFSDFYSFMPFAQGLTLRLAACTALFDTESV